VSERPDGINWDGLEYYAAALGRGVLYAFRGSAPDQPIHRFRLLGLIPEKRYALRFQDQGASSARVVTGKILMQEGIEVRLPLPLSSELVFLTELPAHSA
jgi:hypothetical protein